jgi:hypothetical protein
MPVARQWLSSRNVITASDKHVIIEEMWEAVFYVRFVPRLYKEFRVKSLEKRIRRVGGGRQPART